MMCLVGGMTRVCLVCSGADLQPPPNDPFYPLSSQAHYLKLNIYSTQEQPIGGRRSRRVASCLVQR